MATRLVLGCGPVARSVARSVDRDTVLVVTGDAHWVETLREENIDATRGDVTDPAVLREATDGDAETVVVGSDDPARNVTAARAARRVFPAAFVLADAGAGATDETAAALETAADRVLDRDRTVADAIVERVGDAGVRTRRLQAVLRGFDGPLAVVTHDNPDPDAIASAVALARIAAAAGTDAEVLYGGTISHQENRALVNLLGFDLVSLADRDLETYAGIALVDHSRPGVNNQLPEDTPVDIVVDHHPPRAPVEARFVDLRSHVGATSTLLTGYLHQLNLDLDTAIATGLLFGIRVDTKDFSREVVREDFEAAAFLLEHADLGALERIESPSVSRETLEVVSRAIADRDRRGDVVASCVGDLGDRDALAQAADQLLDMEEVTTTFVYGYTDDTVYASARERATDVDLGEALRDAFGRIGSAGGHADMAGAQIPVGMLVDEADRDDEEARADVIRDVVTKRFFEALDTTGGRSMAAAHATADYLGSDAGEDLYVGPRAYPHDRRTDRSRSREDRSRDSDDRSRDSDDRAASGSGPRERPDGGDG